MDFRILIKDFCRHSLINQSGDLVFIKRRRFALEKQPALYGEKWKILTIVIVSRRNWPSTDNKAKFDLSP